jgi:hypothetical protein
MCFYRFFRSTKHGRLRRLQYNVEVSTGKAHVPGDLGTMPADPEKQCCVKVSKTVKLLRYYLIISVFVVSYMSGKNIRVYLCCG